MRAGESAAHVLMSSSRLVVGVTDVEPEESAFRLARGRLLDRDLDLLRGVLVLDNGAFRGVAAGDPFPNKNRLFISSIASSVGCFDVPLTLFRGLRTRGERLESVSSPVYAVDFVRCAVRLGEGLPKLSKESSRLKAVRLIVR